MIIEQRKKFYGHGRTTVKNKKRLPINFDLASLDLMCSYVVSENRNIKRGQYINLRNLIEMLDMERYINDQERYKRILFIKKGIEARLVKGLTKPITIVKYINGGILDSDIIDINTFASMSNAEIDWINETVAASLSSAFIYEEADYLIDLLTRFKAADYTSISALSKEIEQAIAVLNTKFRKSKVEAATDRVFSLRTENFSSMIRDIYDEITSDYRSLITGMQGMNQLLGGGFENTRLYLLLGITGAGKSMTLLNLAYQIKKYNRNFVPKDPTKTPCVVYLTMENTVTETIQRLFSICTGENMKNYSVEEVEQMLITQGELYLTDDSPIDIIVKYKPNRSEDTSYLYTLIEDLEDEGYECICLMVDHIKRLRSIEYQTDVRLELGNVANEMKTVAMIKDIPVITDSHLNRDGARTIDEQSTKAKADLTRLLGKSNIGESMLMLDNVDLGIILNKEYDSEGNCYMVFKNIKERIQTFRSYICQPFVNGNETKLIEDFYSQTPVFRETLYNENPKLINNTQIKNSNYASLKPIDDNNDIKEYTNRYSSIDMMEDDNIFNIINTDIKEKEELKCPVFYAS